MSIPGVLAMICFNWSIHFVSFTILRIPSGVNTIIEPLPQHHCRDRIARFVSVTKIDVHGPASSVVERNITLAAVQLQRFTQHTPNSFCNGLSLSELTSHNPLGTWARHFQSQQLVDHLDIQRRKVPLPLTDRIFAVPHSHQKLSSTNLAVPSNP